MAIASSAVAPRHIPDIAQSARRGPLWRLLDAVERANMRQAERAIARYRGGPSRNFTDEAEREIERRLPSNP